MGAQKTFYVSPSHGVLSAGEAADVTILLPPSKQAQKGDRFLVLTAAVDESVKKLEKDDWAALAKPDREDQRLTVVLTGGVPAPTEAGTKSLSDKYDELQNATLDVERSLRKVQADLDAAKREADTKPAGIPLFVLVLLVVGSAIVARFV